VNAEKQVQATFTALAGGNRPGTAAGTGQEPRREPARNRGGNQRKNFHTTSLTDWHVSYTTRETGTIGFPIVS